MVNPVPGKSVTTAYKKTGSHWKACGWHTGQDYAAPNGTTVVAARAGTVKHTSYGSAFGSKQFAIVCSDGTEDFYAHTSTRPANGAKVSAGQAVAKVGSEGNVTGPHLHFERHKKAGSWNCSNMDDPMKSHNAGGAPMSGTVYLSKLKYGQKDSDSVKLLQRALNGHKLTGGSTLPVTGNYGDQTDKEVRLCQQQHGYGNDPVKKSNVGPKQADHLFKGTNVKIVNDLEPTTPPQPPVDPEVPPVSGPLFKYFYSGKPSGVQAIGTTYKAVDKGSFTPPGDGFLLSMLYINCAHAFKSGVNEAGFRVRAVRAPFKGQPADNSGYGDFTPNRNLTVPGEFLLTHIWFEMCDGNRKVHWEVDRSSAFSKFDLGTRYTKWVWISVEVFEMLTKTLGMSKAQVAGLMTAFLENPEEEHEFTV